MSILAAHGLRKSYGTHTVLERVDVSLDAGEKVGLVGLNGQGKSTLGRILAGQEVADEGELMVRRGARIVYGEQMPELPGELSALDVVNRACASWQQAMKAYEAANTAFAADPGDEKLAEQQQAAEAELMRQGGWDLGHRVRAVLQHVGIETPEQLVGAMSGGQKRRTALAAALVSAPDVLILDEPTNHLDLDAIEWLERYLIDDFQGTLLLITHDRYLLDRVVTRTLEIDRGRLYSYPGAYAAYLEAKQLRLESEAKTEANRQNFLRNELEWLRRGAKARSTKQKARIDRAEAALQVRAPQADKRAELSLETTRSSKIVVEAAGLSLDVGGKPLVEGLDLVITKTSRVGIVGRNGVGKTSLLRVLIGELEPKTGSSKLAANVQIAYLSQTRSGLDDAESVYENVAGGQSHVEVGGQTRDVRGYLQSFLFDYAKQRQPVGSLSGGERTRVALAKLLSRPANLLILDEPTNDLDVQTLSSLEEMLLAYQGSTLIVTHDRWLLDRVATSILAHDGGARWLRYAGGYSDYADQRRANEQQRALAESAQRTLAGPEHRASSPSRDAARSGKGLTHAERAELTAIEKEIAELENAVSSLESTLADPASYSGQCDIPRLTAELADAQQRISRLMMRWEELELKKESASAG